MGLLQAEKKIKHRASQTIGEDYHKVKKILEKKRKKGCCIRCGKPLPKFKRKWCSEECFDKFFSQFPQRFLWSKIRYGALERDNYTCKKCGYNGKRFETLIVDHITPIALGGEEFDLNNLQTLCVDCNRIKTRDDSKKIAKLRREIKGVVIIKDENKLRFVKRLDNFITPKNK